MGNSSGVRGRWENSLDTLADLEGTMVEQDLSSNVSLTVPSGRLMVNYPQFGINQETASEVRAWNSSHSSLESFVRRTASLARPEPARDPQALALDPNLLPHMDT